MINGAHVLIFTAMRKPTGPFLRDVLEISCIDSGGGC